jgi:hypothetical protein
VIAGDALTVTAKGSPFVNKRREGPAIPFTGGLGRDAFFIAGGAALLLGLAAAGVSNARRRREAHVTR